MEKDFIDRGLVFSFRSHVYDLNESESIAHDGHPYSHLEGYFQSWLYDGDSIICAGGNFGTYMRAVVRIIDSWSKDPTLDGLFDVEKAPRTISNPEGVGDFTDPDYFAAVAAGRLALRGDGDESPS